MNKIYSTAKVPSFENPKKLLSLEPDLAEIFEHSRDNKELEYYWNEWRKATGAKMREDFIENIALTNEAARLEKFSWFIFIYLHIVAKIRINICKLQV